MMDQHHRSSPSRITIQRPSKFSRLGLSTQLWGLVPDASLSIPGNDWNSSPVPSIMQQHRNTSYPPTVSQVHTVYDPLLRHSPNHHPTLSPPGETSVADAWQRPFMALWSLPDIFSGPQAGVGAPDDQFVQVGPMTDWAQRVQRFDSDTLQVDDQTPNESKAFADVVVPNSSGHVCNKTKGAQIPMMPFGAKPLPVDSYPPTSFKKSTSDSTIFFTKLQDANRTPPIYNEGEHQEPPLKLRAPQDQGMGIGKVAKGQYRCSSCWVIFAQRQGLTRHWKDKHEPKNRCEFCKEFTWSQGRRYIYQRHLQEGHPNVVLPSVSATLIARRRGVNVKGWHSHHQHSVVRHTSFVSDSSSAEFASLCGSR
ncbi:hypothetical protein EDB92DRAFT_1108641 [Lactarius akahatsu]|uniref:C2H2-type domain-containing protein n=1 Tax=Lactarius akahatsu TaxID=416441 RepID=A0AAD4Q201_9AGAM|nr:hypothetical protein EDB92DRAFT_1108641 [Lactarius akahatsu]